MKNLDTEIPQQIEALKEDLSRILQALHRQRDAIVKKLAEVDSHLAALRFTDEGPDEDPDEDPTNRDSALRAYILTELSGAEYYVSPPGWGGPHCVMDTVARLIGVFPGGTHADILRDCLFIVAQMPEGSVPQLDLSRAALSTLLYRLKRSGRIVLRGKRPFYRYFLPNAATREVES